MGCRIIFSAEALADLSAIVRHIARDNPQAAVRFGDRLIDQVLILEHFPFLGAPYARRPVVRKLVSRPYIIYYRPRIEAGCVDILRYWHGARGESPL
jgi:toxin ParE1/3/4